MRSCRVPLLWLAMMPCVAILAGAQTLSLPARATNAPTGAEFARRIEFLDFTNREREILLQVTAGNVPSFLRNLCPINVTNVFEGITNVATFHAAPDYLAVGSDDDYL